MSRPGAFVPIAITDRNGHDESVHFGAVVALGRSGEIEYAAGDPTVAIFPRSSNKPMQAVAMLRSGLSLRPNQLALVCASHDGTPLHVEVVRSILADAGLGEDDLANTPGYPLEASAHDQLVRLGEPARAITMNCSGKHSGMLATCVHNRWAHDATYLDEEHPLQRHITDTIAELTGEQPAHIGVDGCGAPAHVMSLVGLARAFGAIAGGAAGAQSVAVATAMTTHPELVGGERRDVTILMRHVEGLVAKDGADGVFAVALPDGRAVALKIADGANRARPPVLVAALERIGVDVGAVAPLLRQPILGHGRPVGHVRAVLP